MATLLQAIGRMWIRRRRLLNVVKIQRLVRLVQRRGLAALIVTRALRRFAGRQFLRRLRATRLVQKAFRKHKYRIPILLQVRVFACFDYLHYVLCVGCALPELALVCLVRWVGHGRPRSSARVSSEFARHAHVLRSHKQPRLFLTLEGAIPVSYTHLTLPTIYSV